MFSPCEGTQTMSTSMHCCSEAIAARKQTGRNPPFSEIVTAKLIEFRSQERPRLEPVVRMHLTRRAGQGLWSAREVISGKWRLLRRQAKTLMVRMAARRRSKLEC